MVIRAEDPCATVLRVFVQPVYFGFCYDTTAIAHEKIVQYQSWQSVKGVPPAGQGRRDPEGKAGLAQQPPSSLVSAPAEVEIGAKDCGVILNRREEVLSLERPSRGPEPAVSRRAARIEVGADQPELGITQNQVGRDRHPPLQDQGKLDRVRAFERETGEDRITPIALVGAVPHRRSVAEVQAKGLRRLHHVLLRPQLSDQDPAGLALLLLGNRRVAPICLLGEYYERYVGIGTEVGVVSIPNSRDDLAQSAPPDPDIPTQYHQTASTGRIPGIGQVESNLGADVTAPRIQAEPRVIFVVSESEFGGVCQWRCDRSRPKRPLKVGTRVRLLLVKIQTTGVGVM